MFILYALFSSCFYTKRLSHAYWYQTFCTILSIVLLLGVVEQCANWIRICPKCSFVKWTRWTTLLQGWPGWGYFVVGTWSPQYSLWNQMSFVLLMKYTLDWDCLEESTATLCFFIWAKLNSHWNFFEIRVPPMGSNSASLLLRSETLQRVVSNGYTTLGLDEWKTSNVHGWMGNSPLSYLLLRWIWPFVT